MNKNFSHQIKAQTVQLIEVAGARNTEYHAVGCAHMKKAIWKSSVIETGAEAMAAALEDDYFHVAPCARKA